MCVCASYRKNTQTFIKKHALHPLYFSRSLHDPYTYVRLYPHNSLSERGTRINQIDDIHMNNETYGFEKCKTTLMAKKGHKGGESNGRSIIYEALKKKITKRANRSEIFLGNVTHRYIAISLYIYICRESQSPTPIVLLLFLLPIYIYIYIYRQPHRLRFSQTALSIVCRRDAAAAAAIRPHHNWFPAFSVIIIEPLPKCRPRRLPTVI